MKVFVKSQKYIVLNYFRTAVPFFTQLIKQDNIDDNEPTWKSLSITEQQSYKDMRKEVSGFMSS